MHIVLRLLPVWERDKRGRTYKPVFECVHQLVVQCYISRANGMQEKSDFVFGRKYSLPPSEITIAEILKEQGYHTAVWKMASRGPKASRVNKKWPVSHPGMHGFDSWWVTPASTPSLQPNCVCFGKSQCPLYGHAFTSCMNYYTIDSNTNELKGWPEPIAGDDSLFLHI